MKRCIVHCDKCKESIDAPKAAPIRLYDAEANLDYDLCRKCYELLLKWLFPNKRMRLGSKR